ncbi:MAG: hypothetical protein Q6373_007370 [Candidatus Sigynarchaeota archaeon]
MVAKDERKREQLAGAEENIFQKMLDQVTDYAMKILNLKPKDSPAAAKPGDSATADSKSTETASSGDILAKAKELSKNAVKGIVNTGDSILKSLKLDENEQVKKMTEDAKKFLKQMGLLDEEFENEEYY